MKKNRDQKKSSAKGGQSRKGGWILLGGILFAVAFMVRSECSPTHRPQGKKESPQKIIVERIPAAEARKIGIDPRNH